MPVTWRREDMGYAAAAAAAVAFIAFLVFGNFGLVPSPLAPAGGQDEVLVATQALQALEQAIDEDEAGPSVAPPAAPPVRSAPPVPVAPKPPVARDTQIPTAAITTADGTKLTVAQAATIEGTAADQGSGIKKLDVTFTPGTGSPQTVAAELECRTGRRSCTWSAEAPGVVGTYTVIAKAFDGEGNTATTEAIEITLVNVGGPVEDLGDTVGGVVGGLGRTVGGLLGGL